WPAPVPRFATAIVRIEPDAPQCLPAAMRTAFHVTPVLVLLADGHTTVGTGVVFHLGRSRRRGRMFTTLSLGGGVTFRSTAFATAQRRIDHRLVFPGVVTVRPDVFCWNGSSATCHVNRFAPGYRRLCLPR